MVMLMDNTVYLDESENPPDKVNPGKPHIYTIAACVGTAKQWIKFRKSWKKVLERDVLPKWREVYGEGKPVFFHMTDFANKHSKIYGDWPEAKKVAFLRELHSIMEKHSMQRFATGIPMADYEGLAEAEKVYFGHPHVCAAINCMKHIRIWADSVNLRAPMLYVFEKGSVHEKKIKILETLMSDEQKDAYRIGSIAFADKRELSPLQAADIIAVETRWEMSRNLDAGNTRSARKSLLNLNVRSLDRWYLMDKRHFGEILDRPDVKEILSGENVNEIVAYAKKRGMI